MISVARIPKISKLWIRLFSEWIRPEVRPTLDRDRARRALSEYIIGLTGDCSWVNWHDFLFYF